jgi:tetratricopeptide (TPR) repeat protein
MTDEELLQQGEARPRQLASTAGPSAPETIQAWLDLGDAAEQEMAWDVAERAWEAVIAAAEAGGEVDAARPSISPALRGLGTRRLVQQRLEEARALFERDLALNEHLYPGGHAQLAISFDNLALVMERIGDKEEALQLRKNQRAVLLATGASEGRVADVDQRIAKLTA